MGKALDLTGKRFGMLVVLNYSHHIKDKRAWLCQCDCGKQVDFITTRLTSKLVTNRATSCGCGRHAKLLETCNKKVPDLRGTLVGKFTVLSFAGRNARSMKMWLCQCSCGREVVLQEKQIKDGLTTSCDNCNPHKHGLTKSKEHIVWVSMKSRCSCTTNNDYANYGGRGIKVCERWLESFKNFLQDMGPIPKPGYTIERLDVNKDYSPDNCIWLNRKGQGRNTRTNVLNEELVKHIKEAYRGGSSRKEIAHNLGIKSGTIGSVIYRRSWKEVGEE